MITCAIDLGKFNSVCCFFDPATRKHPFETIATKGSHIELLSSQLRSAGRKAKRQSKLAFTWDGAGG